MEIDAQLNRVRLLEPQPGMPANAMPGLGQLIPRPNIMLRGMISAALLILLGAYLLFRGFAYGYGAMLLAVGAVIAYNSYRIGTRLEGLRELAETPFFHIAPAADELLIAGSKVSVRTPDGQWLVARMTRQHQMLLAGIRRAWVLGPDGKGRGFLQLPGSYRVIAVRLRSEPPSGSVPLVPVVREPLPPGRDPVLAAHRKWTSGFAAKSAVVNLIISGIAFWAVTESDHPHRRGEFSESFLSVGAAFVFALTAMSGLLLLVGAVKAMRPIPAEATWLELTVRQIQPYRLTRSGLTTMRGQAVLPDGSVLEFKTARIDGSLAVTAAATGQIWAITPIRPGKYAKIGLPGYPVIGLAKFTRP